MFKKLERWLYNITYKLHFLFFKSANFIIQVETIAAIHYIMIEEEINIPNEFKVKIKKFGDNMLANNPELRTSIIKTTILLCKYIEESSHDK